MIKKATIREEWEKLVKILFFPPVFIVIILSLLFLCFSIFLPKNVVLSAFVNILLTLMTGLLGGLIANLWDEKSRNERLKIRGESAIRGLKSVNRMVVDLGERIGDSMGQLSKTKEDRLTPIQKVFFDEVVLRSIQIQEEIINSIEDWKDLVPEADISSQYSEVIVTFPRFSRHS